MTDPICPVCGTTMRGDAALSAEPCPRCVKTNSAVREIKDAEVAIDRARADMARYAKVRTRVAREAVAAGVAPATLARGLGVTRQRVNSLLKRAGVEGGTS